MQIHLLFRTIYLFLLAQITGLFLAEQLLIYQNPFSFALGNSVTPKDLLLFFCISTILLLLIQKIRHAHIFFRGLFFAAAFVGILMVFAAVFPVEISLPVSLLFVIGLILVPEVWVHDLVILIASAGIAGTVGIQMPWQWSVWALVLFSAYDLIAVYVTKHMVDIAHQMLKANAIFAFIIPADHTSYRASISQVRPGAGFLVLGGGDIILPMLFACSMLVVSPVVSMTIIGGAILGLVANHMVLLRAKQPIPALPMITIGCLIGFLIGMML